MDFLSLRAWTQTKAMSWTRSSSKPRSASDHEGLCATLIDETMPVMPGMVQASHPRSAFLEDTLQLLAIIFKSRGKHASQELCSAHQACLSEAPQHPISTTWDQLPTESRFSSKYKHVILQSDAWRAISV